MKCVRANEFLAKNRRCLLFIYFGTLVKLWKWMKERKNSLARDFPTIKSFCVYLLTRTTDETVPNERTNEIKWIYFGTFRSHSFIDPLCDYVMILIWKSDFHYQDRKKTRERNEKCLCRWCHHSFVVLSLCYTYTKRKQVSMDSFWHTPYRMCNVFSMVYLWLRTE